MEFQTLRKSHKKQIIMGAIAICVIGGALTFSLTRAKYEIANDLELAKGTINYKAYDFKIMAMYKSEDKTNYTEIEEMPSEGYTINESKSYCNMSNGNKDTTAILKTIDGNHSISKLKKNDRCYLYFDKKITASDTILAGITVKPGNPTFTNAATTDEGVYSMSDGMYGGTSYYWRGASTTNHVIFANKCWRIVRINGDKSIRLIYNGAVSSGKCTGNGSNSGSIAVTSQAYYPQYNRSEYVGYTFTQGSQRGTTTSSNLKSQTDTWYNNNIGNNTTYSSRVADGKFCNDQNTASGYGWSSQPSSTFYYAGYDRGGAKSASSVTPTLACNNASDVYTLKAGAITMDEVVMAGGKWVTANSSYYLYNGQYYWTMSPYSWYGGNPACVFLVYSDGYLNASYVFNTTPGVRPVINLKADTLFAIGGDGTQNNPYVVS